ncbi:uncharacterized protein LOC131890406 isoform X3 [Tigriopus californicus]|uniref:uncharacterized protein LOC131890406 isoform X3 n=1 Tax=Tigriopus californicus TaxID=6832 RepID=UPI0027DA4AED|nr:uncharacterized protein LOC131890406 isoform X3 [Tigriopus californicus]
MALESKSMTQVLTILLAVVLSQTLTVNGFFLPSSSSSTFSTKEGRQTDLASMPEGDIMVMKDNQRAQYSCFPWVFNPGCYLNSLVDWNWVCRTNTLGWEQCEIMSTTRLVNSETDAEDDSVVTLVDNYGDLEEELDENLEEILENSKRKTSEDVLKEVNELQKVREDIKALNRVRLPPNETVEA